MAEKEKEKMMERGDALACEAVRLRTHKVIHYTLIVYLPIVSLDKIDSNNITNQTTKENLKISAH